MINSVTLVGRLTKDPEMRYTQSGVAVARFTLACDRPFTGQDGKKETDFINCTVWRKQAENVAKYLKKGSLAGVQGRIQVSSYDDKDGKRVYQTEVVADSVRFLDSKSDGVKSSPKQDAPKSSSNAFDPFAGTPDTQKTVDPFSKDAGVINLSDDDLPF